MLMFTVDVAANLAGPALTLSAFLFSTVLVRVSIVLAVAYVEKYRPKMSRKGFEARKLCGRSNAALLAARRD